MTRNERLQAFKKVITGLQAHPSMLTIDPSYPAVVNHLVGFQVAERVLLGDDLLCNFQSFVNRRLGRACTVWWPHIIRDMLADGDDVKALSVLFELVNEYLECQDPEQSGDTRAIEEL